MKQYSKNTSRQRGFTLIELLVVIAVIGLLASIVMASLTKARVKGRDSARKTALHQIETALELYYNLHTAYPSTGATSPTTNAVQSTNATWATGLGPILTDATISTLPVDPVNIDTGSQCWAGPATRNTMYTYLSDGQHYILCTWMENTSDAGTLQYRDVQSPWDPNAYLYRDFGYSAYNFIIAK